MTEETSSATARSSPWSDQFLDAKRQRGDPLADAVVAEIFASGEVRAVDKLLVSLTANDQALSSDLPESVRAYFEETATPPPMDASLVDRGIQVFSLYGPEVLLCLGFYALPASYAARKGVQVLYRTAFLKKRPMRRVFETTRMAVEVMVPGGLEAGGSGIRTIQKVRLMHAAIRHMLLHDEANPWDPALGLPINQEDLAGTLMTFSYVVLDGLNHIHAHLNPNDQAGYLHLWSAVGQMMGVDDDLNPETVAEAMEMTKRIRERQFEPCPEGKALTHALIDGFADLLPSRKPELPAAMVHFFLDNDGLMHQNIAEMLDVPPGGWRSILPNMMAAATGILSFLGAHVPDEVRPMRWLSRELVVGLLTMSPAAGHATFSIPDHLYEDWHLDVPGTAV